MSRIHSSRVVIRLLWTLVPIALIWGVLFFVSVSPASTGKNGGEILIGLSLGLTGKYSEMSRMQLKGFLLWEEMVNETGGVLGKKVKLLIEDDESEPKKAVAIYRDFITRRKVDFLFAPYSSEITGAVMPLVDENGYFLLASGASSDELWRRGYKGLFGVYVPASKYAVGFLELVALEGLKTIAVIYADDSFSRSAGMGAVKWARRFGLKDVYTREFKKGTMDLTGIVEELKDIRPDAVILCGHFLESVRFKRAMIEGKWQPMAFFATVGPVVPDYVKVLKDDAELTFSASQWEYSEGKNYPGGREFWNRFLDRWEEEPNYHAACAFAAGEILKKAVEVAGTLDRAAVIRTIYSLDAMTIIGRFGVDSTGMQVRHIPFTIQIQGGKRVVVWPEDMAEGKPVFSVRRSEAPSSGD